MLISPAHASGGVFEEWAKRCSVFRGFPQTDFREPFIFLPCHFFAHIQAQLPAGLNASLRLREMLFQLS